MKKKYRLLKDDPLWYKDAVIYELHVKAFKDSNDDGIGDIPGLIEKLDHLQDLGITALWLLPFYPSPFRDDGYDIADYYNIHPDYGTLHEFRELLKQAHKRGIRVITELVLNHTSDQHPWFQRARRAKKGSAWRDFYVWSDTPDRYRDARVIFNDFETSNWTWDPVAKAYYWHRFYSHQPDLNFDNPRVHKEMSKVIDFWLGMGVDGLRLDAVPYLYEREGTNCENLPETHQFLKKLRKHVDDKFRNKMLLAEANQWVDDAVAYFGSGDECNMAFNFPLMPRIFMAVHMEDRFPIVDILDPAVTIPESCQWAMFLRNHDELTLEMVTDEERDYMYRVYASESRAKINLGIRRRLGPLLGNNRRRIELMNTLLFSLPGTPVIYYGDEIGMGDNYYLGDRDGVRTPMQWTPDRNAGFSSTNPQKLYLPVIIDPEYHYESVNVENQKRNLSSLLWWTKRVIAMRNRSKAFSRGDIKFINSNNHRVLVFTRQYEKEIILTVFNLSRFSQVAELSLSDYAGYVPTEMFSNNQFPGIKKTPYVITLGPHNYFWFTLKKPRGTKEQSKRAAYQEIMSVSDMDELLHGLYREKFENTVLLKYLGKARWFAGKGRIVRRLSIVEEAPFSAGNVKGSVLVLKVDYNEGMPEHYFLPICPVCGQDAQTCRQNHPENIIASLSMNGKQCVIVDAVCLENFRQLLVDVISKRRKLKGSAGDFSGRTGSLLRPLLKEKGVPPVSSLSPAQQSNTSMIYDGQMILKMFRKLEEGMNPDVEIGRAITERTEFRNIPPFYGTIEYHAGRGNNTYAAILQGYVPNEGDGWKYVQNELKALFDRLPSLKKEIARVPEIDSIMFESDILSEHEGHNGIIGPLFVQMIERLGRRTGEMHLALSSLKTQAFEPEPFSLLYQKSLYQSMKALINHVFGTLENNVVGLSREMQDQAVAVLDARLKVLALQRKITRKKMSAMKIRIHGDYHLGQVLHTGKDFCIIDFEGEPMRALSERRLKRSPLRDIAGMIRSFHYAVNTALVDTSVAGSKNGEVIKRYVSQWYYYVSSVFLLSYLDTVGDAPFLPKRMEDFVVLFDAFLLDKAVYELGYELNNRPDWIGIPIKSILYILENSTIEL